VLNVDVCGYLRCANNVIWDIYYKRKAYKLWFMGFKTARSKHKQRMFPLILSNFTKDKEPKRLVSALKLMC